MGELLQTGMGVWPGSSRSRQRGSYRGSRAAVESWRAGTLEMRALPCGRRPSPSSLRTDSDCSAAAKALATPWEMPSVTPAVS
jgi:hypothetical protein